jgi:hypothetical protein
MWYWSSVVAADEDHERLAVDSSPDPPPARCQKLMLLRGSQPATRRRGADVDAQLRAS